MGVGVSASYGFDGSVTEAQWAVIGAPTSRGYVEGAACTPGAGARSVVVAAGTVWALHGYHSVSGATLSLPENVSGQPRVDVVVLDVDYSADSASVVALAGTPAASPVAPALTQIAGLRWQVPLAHVSVAPGAGVLPVTALRDVRPGPWLPQTPASPWVAYGGGFRVPAVRVTHTGDVELRGVVRSASPMTSPFGQPLLTLPASWRPAAVEIFTVAASHGAPPYHIGERVDVYPDGRVLPVYPYSTAGTTHWYSLTQITWTPG